MEGYPSNTTPATGSSESDAATCVAIRPPIDLPPMNIHERALFTSRRTVSMTDR